MKIQSSAKMLGRIKIAPSGMTSGWVLAVTALMSRYYGLVGSSHGRYAGI